MPAQKLSVSLPISLVQFIDNYKTAYQYKSRSRVIQEALKLLRLRELEAFSQQASEEVEVGEPHC